MSLEAYPAHNAVLVGDALTTISLNREWRKIISSAIEEFLFHRAKDELTLDNQDLLMELYQDLYNAETYMNRKFRAVNLSIGANRSTGSTTPVIMTGSTFNHTFTYKNAKITVFNLELFGSASNVNPRAIVDVNGETAIQEGFASTNGVAQRGMQLESVFENLPVGVSKTIGLKFFVNTGSCTANANSELIFMIEEWD